MISPSRRPARPARRAVAVTLAVAFGLAGCGASASLAPPITVSTPATTAATPTLTLRDCTADELAADTAAGGATRSFEPTSPMPQPGAMPSGSTMAAIAQRGRLIVGVSGDTLLFGSRNPISGLIEGFDIDVLTQVATAIFGPTGASKIEYRVINYADRIPKLLAGPTNGGVDIVAHTMTINCKRWLVINFSSEYYHAGQKVLVKKDSGFTSVADLEAAKATVCAPNGSTNIDEISDTAKHPGLVVIGKDDITDCLVAMQQGEADATTGDDTVLAGFAVQDPNTQVVGAAFTDEPYGLGIAKQNADNARTANGVLAAMRADGRWAAIYTKWLLDTKVFTSVPTPPVAIYGRTA